MVILFGIPAGIGLVVEETGGVHRLAVELAAGERELRLREHRRAVECDGLEAADGELLLRTARVGPAVVHLLAVLLGQKADGKPFAPVEQLAGEPLGPQKDP